MKRVFLILLSLLAVPAFAAETITLAPVACGTARDCSPPTDTGDVVQFNATYGNFLRLYLNGKLYSSPGQEYLTAFDSYQVQADDGSIVLLTANFTTYSTCVRSGRGQHCTKHWYLTNGFLLTQ